MYQKNLNIVYTTNSPALSIKYTSSCCWAQFDSQILLRNLVRFSLSNPTSAVLKQQHDIGVSFQAHLFTNPLYGKKLTNSHPNTAFVFQKKLDNNYYIVE